VAAGSDGYADGGAVDFSWMDGGSSDTDTDTDCGAGASDSGGCDGGGGGGD
jgi:hypothetical protein